MPLNSACSPSRCAHAPPRTSTVLIRTVPSPRGFVLSGGIHNGALPAPPATSSGAELGAVLDSAGAEMIRWGTAVGLSQAIAHAERLVPGISLPYVAYQAFAALSEAGRGNLMRALQTLPFTSLAPDAALQVLARLLQRILPDTTLPPCDPSRWVIGIALCAVLHALARPLPVRTPATAAGRSLVAMVQWLRTLATLQAGIQTVRNLHGRPMCSTGFVPAVAVVERRNGTGAFPAWTAALNDQRQLSLSGVGSAWPLPGASARNAKPKPNPNPKPPRLGTQGTAGRPGGGTSSAQRGHSAHVRRGSTRTAGKPIGESPGATNTRRETSTLVKKQSPLSQYGQVSKESTAVGKQSSSHGSENQHPAMGEDARKSVPAAISPHAVLPAGPPQSDCSAGCNASEQAGTHASASAEIPLPAVIRCLRFHDTGEALLQVDKMRFSATQAGFCVPPSTERHFTDLFAAAFPARGTQPHWIRTHLVHEHLPDAQRQQGARKYVGLGQIQRGELRDPTPLARDHLYSPMTLSLMSDDQLRRRHIPSSQILSRNSFRLLHHDNAAGTRRNLIAFFISPGEDVCRGVRPGFLEVTADPDGGFALKDERSGFGLHGSTLTALVAGVQKMSGCTHDAAVEGVRHLFVRERSSWCADAPHAQQAINENLPFLVARTLRITGQQQDIVLYRSSFSIGSNALVFMDERGRVGALQLYASTTVDDRVLVTARQTEFATRFMQAHGLQEGDQQRLPELIDRLERRGMTWIPGGMGARCDARPARHDGAPVIACGLPPTPAQTEPTDTPAARHSWFSWASGVLQYVDHNGMGGTLRFLHTGEHGRNYRMADDNPDAAVAFARRNGLLPQARYAEDEILWLLNGEGYVRVSQPAPEEEVDTEASSSSLEAS